MDSAVNKLLIVDGSPLNADLLSFWLQAEDLQVFTAENGLHAMAKLEFWHPDIVAVNVVLPDISGFDLCKKIKAISEETLVLCVSTMESEHHRLRAEEMGADDYYETTAERYLFVSKIRSLLRVRRLSKQLHRRYAELEEVHSLLNRQLEMGMQVQRALIPDINAKFGDCELQSRYYPAMGVGGDFFNVLRLNSDSFGIVMGDVSGYGIAAAFVTALLNMMIKNLAMTHTGPAKVLFHLNNEMYGMFENSESPLYACVFFAMVNMSARVVRYANAGQNPPFFVDATDNTVQELELAGRPVGMMKDSTYKSGFINYRPSDLLLLHTDGLQDALYKEQPDEFARQMKEILLDISHHTSIDGMLDTICGNFCQTPETKPGAKRMDSSVDDVSMIICRL
jgi:sigma-B regulation protein RsbU (phosphoserine phosphatase)